MPNLKESLGTADISLVEVRAHPQTRIELVAPLPQRNCPWHQHFRRFRLISLRNILRRPSRKNCFLLFLVVLLCCTGLAHGLDPQKNIDQYGHDSWTSQSARDPSTILRVLLAEDNPVNQRVASRLLEKRGHRVQVVSDGREALAALEKETFDLVFMDVQMPEMDGFEA